LIKIDPVKYDASPAERDERAKSSGALHKLPTA
jgi:hypothetical protein